MMKIGDRPPSVKADPLYDADERVVLDITLIIVTLSTIESCPCPMPEFER
jgi:hypothetical protein